MVPLRSEYGVESSAVADCQYRMPKLVLYDIDRDTSKSPTKNNRKHRKYRLGWDTVALAVGVITALAFFVISFASFLWTTTVADRSSFSPTLPIIAKRVAPGDTLWRYANQYGDPNTYILDRVEALARENHLRPNSPLVPGQVIHVAVHNPSIIARLAQQHPSRIAALPRS